MHKSRIIIINLRKECHECRAPRPAPKELWKHAYRRAERDNAILNVEQNVREEEEEETNYLVGRGKYANTAAPEWLDDRSC